MGRGDRILAALVGIAIYAAVSAWTIDRYGAALFWPAFVTQFGATLLAVVLAFAIENRREQRALVAADENLTQRRQAEARKRLLALGDELEKNQVSISEIVKGIEDEAPDGQFKLVHPQLLGGTWASSGERLGDLLQQYELVARLSTFYGRLEELRWRVRHRTEVMSDRMDRMTLALAKELVGEVAGLLDDVRAQEPNPVIRPVGLVHARAVGGSIQPTGSVTTE